MRPKARTDALIVETLPDETLIYDERNDKAHCLNGTAALVWRLADGEKTVDEISRRVSREFGIRGAKDVVSATLDQLDRARLLDQAPARSSQRRISRRELGRKLAYTGAAFVAIPAVLTIGAPTAASAASCFALDQSCTRSNDCCSHCCKNVSPGINTCKPGGGACLPA